MAAMKCLAVLLVVQLFLVKSGLDAAPNGLNAFKKSVVVAKTDADAKAGNAEAISKNTVFAFGKKPSADSQSNAEAASDATGERAHATADGNGKGLFVLEKTELTEKANGKAKKTVEYDATFAGHEFKKTFKVPVKGG